MKTSRDATQDRTPSGNAGARALTVRDECDAYRAVAKVLRRDLRNAGVAMRWDDPARVALRSAMDTFCKAGLDAGTAALASVRAAFMPAACYIDGTCTDPRD